MCNTTSELGVEHPRGTHRVQHVQHVFNLQHLPLPGAVEQPQTRFFAATGALAVIPSIHGSSVYLWATVYVPSAEEVRQHRAPVYEPNVVRQYMLNH